jgi:hypothetical protein
MVLYLVSSSLLFHFFFLLFILGSNVSSAPTPIKKKKNTLSRGLGMASTPVMEGWRDRVIRTLFDLQSALKKSIQFGRHVALFTHVREERESAYWSTGLSPLRAHPTAPIDRPRAYRCATLGESIGIGSLEPPNSSWHTWLRTSSTRHQRQARPACSR